MGLLGVGGGMHSTECYSGLLYILPVQFHYEIRVDALFVFRRLTQLSLSISSMQRFYTVLGHTCSFITQLISATWL